MRRILTRLTYWLHWRREQRELAEEMAAHRERLAGGAAGAAGWGNELARREEARGVWLWPWLEAVGQGLRQGARRLRRAPGFATVAILTLALGIGASTAIFSVVEAVMLHPLPYPAADRIVAYSLENHLAPGGVQSGLTLAQIEYLRDHTRTLAPVAGYRGVGVTSMLHGQAVTWANEEQVTDGFFAVLGIRPWMGRGIARADTSANAARVAVLSYGLWRSAFRGAPDAIGESVTLAGQATRVVGVLPKAFVFQEQPADIYIAIRAGNGLGNRGTNTAAIGRLRPGITIAAAAQEAAQLGAALRRQGLLPRYLSGIGASRYQALESHDVASSLWLLLAAVGLLLLIACANVAGLVLAQTLGRREEIALRRALGAGGGRLWVQFLSEGLVLGVVGGAAGVGLAALALRALAARLPWDIPLAAPLALDARVLAFAVALTLGTSLTVALAGLWQGSGPRLAVTRFGKSGRARDLLIVAEVALSLLLLVGAGLLLKSLWRLQQQPLGFDPAGRVIFQTELPAAPATSAAAAGQFEQQLQARLQALPGVAQAASASLLPLEGQGNIPGEPLARPALGTAVEYRSVSADFFSAMGIPLLAGRNFLASDDAAAAPVAVVGAKLARQWFATAGALGGAVRLGAIGSNVYDANLAAKPLRVVGIAGDTQIESLGEPARLTVYVPAAQAPDWASWWVVRGRGLNAATLRNAVAELNPNARVSNLGPYAEVVGQALARPRFEARLVALFALLALALAAIGLYGVLAFAVTARTRELGIRMALGARPSTLLRQVAGHGLALALAGAALGLAAAWPLAQLTASLLYNVHPHDPAVLAGATAAVLAAAAAASYLPALRATRVDPVRALRQE